MAISDHLEKIEYFRQICEAGSLRQAANDIRLSQSSLTVAVQKLEDAIGARLLIRTKKGVRTTAEGELLYGFARDLASRLADLEARIHAPPGTVAGRISIGAYDSIAVYWLPTVLRHLKKALPHVHISISIGVSGTLLNRVKGGDLNIAIVVAPPKDPTVTVHDLFSDSFGFYGARNVINRDPANRGSLIGMFSARVTETQTLGDALREIGVNLQGSLDVESFEIAKALAEQGVGMAVLPERVAVHKSSLIRVKQRPFGKHKICLVTSKETGSTRQLTDLVQKEMTDLAQLWN